MSSLNSFDLLGVDDSEDPAQLIAAVAKKEAEAAAAAAEAAAKEAAKEGASQATPAGKGGVAELPSKPLHPKQAVKEARNEAQRGGGRGDGRGRGRGDGRGGRGRGDGRGRGGRGYDRGFGDNENSNSTYNGYSGGFGGTEGEDGGKVSERRGGYGGNRGGRRGDFGNGDVRYDGERPPRRTFERHSGSGRVNDVKREGAGLGNWGTPSDDIVAETEGPVNEVEKNVGTEKQSEQETVENEKKDAPTTESDEKKEQSDEKKEQEAEEKEMTLDEYEKVLEEKRKALLALKSEERKVDLDKELKAMQLLSNKKNDEEVFVKLGTDKDKRKEVVVGDKAKKSVSINEFLKPAEGENYYRQGGRGGRGRGGGGGGGGRGRGGYGGGGYGGNYSNNVEAAPSIGDARHFPTLGGK